MRSTIIIITKNDFYFIFPDASPGRAGRAGKPLSHRPPPPPQLPCRKANSAQSPAPRAAAPAGCDAPAAGSGTPPRCRRCHPSLAPQCHPRRSHGSATRLRFPGPRRHGWRGSGGAGRKKTAAIRASRTPPRPALPGVPSSGTLPRSFLSYRGTKPASERASPVSRLWLRPIQLLKQMKTWPIVRCSARLESFFPDECGEH